MIMLMDNTESNFQLIVSWPITTADNKSFNREVCSKRQSNGRNQLCVCVSLFMWIYAICTRNLALKYYTIFADVFQKSMQIHRKKQKQTHSAIAATTPIAIATFIEALDLQCYRQSTHIYYIFDGLPFDIILSKQAAKHCSRQIKSFTHISHWKPFKLIVENHYHIYFTHNSHSGKIANVTQLLFFFFLVHIHSNTYANQHTSIHVTRTNSQSHWDHDFSLRFRFLSPFNVDVDVECC